MSLIKKNIAANFIGKGWTSVMALVFVPFYIHFMGIEAYGLVGFFSYLLALSIVLDLGLNVTLSREVARLSVLEGKSHEMRDLVRTLEVIYWSIAVLIGVGVVISAPFIVRYWVKAESLSPNSVEQAVVLMGVAIALHLPFSLYSGGLVGLQRQVLLNGVSASMATVRGVGAVAVLWLIAPTIRNFFLWQIVVSAGLTALTAYSLWSRLPASEEKARFRGRVLSRIGRFSLGVGGITLISVLVTHADKIILSKLLTLEWFGYYTLATTAAGILLFFSYPVVAAVTPRLTQLFAQKDEPKLTVLYHQSAQLISVIILPVSLALILFSREFLLVWTGSEQIAQNTHLTLSILATGTALNALMNMPYSTQLAYGWTRLAFYQNLISAILLIPLLLWAATRYGMTGAAMVWALLNLGYLTIGIQIMHRRILRKSKWRWYFVDNGLPLMAVLLVSVPGRLMMPHFESPFIIVVWVGGVFLLSLIASAVMSPFVRGVFMQFLYGSRGPERA